MVFFCRLKIRFDALKRKTIIAHRRSLSQCGAPRHLMYFVLFKYSYCDGGDNDVTMQTMTILLDSKEIQPVYPKGNKSILNIHWKD